ncbi:unnamed protein product [Prorocentrum cordatum]|uniref:Uncharacterized protein n=1 Tax=Prorocentrum cordatum TaxID=2364126 RepID=A0ABN9Q502_9DINO|nr:unnamed protein product [Polarella glacialis]
MGCSHILVERDIAEVGNQRFYWNYQCRGQHYIRESVVFLFGEPHVSERISTIRTTSVPSDAEAATQGTQGEKSSFRFFCRSSCMGDKIGGMFNTCSSTVSITFECRIMEWPQHLWLQARDRSSNSLTSSARPKAKWLVVQASQPCEGGEMLPVRKISLPSRF